MLILWAVIFALVVVISFWYRREEKPSVTWVDHVSHCHPMTLTENPFILKLHNTGSATLQGIECVLTSKVKCIVQDFWGVCIHDLRLCILRDWLNLKNIMQTGQLLRNSCHSTGDVKIELPCTDKILKFMPKSPLSGADFEGNPRLDYPLVVLLIRDDLYEPTGSCLVTGLLTIVHIKDESLRLDTQVLFQFLKLSNNLVMDMKKLYVSSDSSGDESSRDPCVICQTNPSSVVILYCRHLCLCTECFPKVDKCPMCRSMIHSHFIISVDE